MDLKIGDILKCTKGNLIAGSEDYICESFSKDTRNINKDDTYIGIKGENFDGNIFWKDAFEKGASTVIINKTSLNKEEIEKYRMLKKNIIMVEDTKEALVQMAKLKRDMYGDNLIVVGVTGSVGKTSTKDIIASVLSQKYNTLKTEGNNNNDIGLPLTILRLRNHQVAVVEMGMNHLGEISKLTNIAKPTIAVITNIGTSHIGNLGSRENILKAKLEILEGMNYKKIVINNDNDLLNKWANNNGKDIEIHKFGIKNDSECKATSISYGDNKSNFECVFNDEVFDIEVPVQGEHFVLNALCGATIGKLCGLNNEQIREGIKNFSLTKKRMEVFNLRDDITIINDSYNASFESMKASLEYLATTNSRRKIAVLGDMFELGDFSEELHRKVGKVIYEKNIDVLVAVGDKSQFIVDEARRLGMNNKQIHYFDNKDNLKNFLCNYIEKGDMVLFKASNGMKLFEIAEDICSFYK